MEEVLDLLIKIQKFDDEIKETETKIKAIPDKITKLQKEIKEANDNFKEKENRVQNLKKEYKMKEGDIAENETKINKLNSQTFAVKTNEEYRAIISEIEFLKKENKRIEDEMMSLLEEEEKLKDTLQNSRQETNEYTEVRKKKISALEAEEKELKSKVAEAKKNFDEHFEKLPEDIQKMYRKIEKVRGKAVCLIDNETCTGCSTILTPQFLNELKKRKEILLCDNCGRILIHVASDEKK